MMSSTQQRLLGVCLLAAGLLLGASGARAQLEINQDAVGRFFFTEEERNVMEAVRQGIIDPEILRPEEQIFVTPQLDIRRLSSTPAFRKWAISCSAIRSFLITALIRMKAADGSTKTRLLAGGGLVLNEDQLEDLANSLGLVFHLDDSDGSVIYVDDKLFKTRIALRRGDTIGRTGEVTSANSRRKRAIIVKKGG